MRRSRAKRRWIDPDPRFGSLQIARFTNVLMERGKKSVAQKVIYGAFDIIEKKTKQDPLEVFDKAIRNVGPLLEVKGRRIGGANYQIPHEVHGHRREALAYRWIIEVARDRKGGAMKDKLANELIEASKKEGSAMKKRAQVHKMAEANKAFAHFAVR